MATSGMMGFQDPNSHFCVMLIMLHDYNMMFVICTVVLVFYFILAYYLNSYNVRYLLHGNSVETSWTMAPMFVLTDMAVPSLQVLYYSENTHTYLYTFKSIGHQWYWSYEFYEKGKHLIYDSYMISENRLKFDGFRLLDVDNRLVLPLQTPIRNIVSSGDVIHSWAMPSLGVKVDALPGRLNQVSLYTLRSGVYYGQCSEICGANHSFMPIVLESTKKRYFKEWLLKLFNKNNN